MNRKIIKEACVGSYEEAMDAYKKGASRIELCADLNVGGVTPSFGTIKQSIKNIPLPIFVLIRPRAGDFFYTDDEFEVMRNDIKISREIGATGVVFGALTNNKLLDMRIQLLIDEADGLEKTFHKAFDEVEDKQQLLEQLIALKFHRILSSGSKSSFFDGLENLKILLKRAEQRIKLVACGGITEHNLEYAINNLETNEFHGKLIVGKLNNR
ncbi:copper homeostasis protein CutC [Thorsellia kenyensis]|uniref:PF03932 family protein CutC n=1 Tax=Thorsellia kenyensis TaxID=1549888 RepID=A0ABV6CC45_9GAMM